MHPASRFALTAALLSLLAACGGGDDSPSKTACHQGAYCTELEGSDLDVGETDRLCADGGGTAMAACPFEGALGVCTRQDGITIRDFTYQPAQLEFAQTMCIAFEGTWSTP